MEVNIMKNRSIFLIIILFSLVSCGPVYRTTHDYYPPENMDGRNCLNSCDNIRQSCTSNCRDREQNCKMSSQVVDVVKKSSCYKRKKYCTAHPEASDCWIDKNDDCNDYSSSHDECSSEECRADCTEYYNRCYINCGGSINTRTVCVSDCD